MEDRPVNSILKKEHKRDFYSIMADYYDEIFVPHGPKFDFIKKYIEKNEKNILDMGCATGAVPIFLGQNKKRVTGIDLDSKMIDLAQKKSSETDYSNGKPPFFKISDMTKFDMKSQPDVVLILGNTLVHLQSKQAIETFLLESAKNLNYKKIIIQIVNYDRIVSKNIQELPLIKSNSLTFERSYIYNVDDIKMQDSKEKIGFCTKITLHNSKEVFHGSTWLIPLKKDELQTMLVNAGFNKIQIYGSYREDEWCLDSFHTIMVANR